MLIIFLIRNKEEIQEEKVPWGVIRYSNKWRKKWEIIIMFAATYNGFTVPYFIAFEPKYQFTQGYDIINIIIDLIFI